MGRIEARFILGCLLVAFGLTAAAALAAEIREGDAWAIDRVLLLDLRVPGNLGQAIGPRWFHEVARDISALGGFTVLSLTTAFSCFMLATHRHPRRAAILAASVIFAQIAAELIKHLVGRPRPDIVPHLDLVYSSSFPSGHAMMSPVVYMTLASLLAAGERKIADKLVLQGCAALLVLCIGLSRIYLGVHWPSDVLGGWILGSTFALIATFVLHRMGG
jgi:undecaprenyl-diphosphatase